MRNFKIRILSAMSLTTNSYKFTNNTLRNIFSFIFCAIKDDLHEAETVKSYNFIVELAHRVPLKDNLLNFIIFLSVFIVGASRRVSNGNLEEISFPPYLLWICSCYMILF